MNFCSCLLELIVSVCILYFIDQLSHVRIGIKKIYIYKNQLIESKGKIKIEIKIKKRNVFAFTISI